jgi:hypothetical protein
MTAKQNPYEIDAMACIMHAAQEGVPIDTYTKRVTDYARKRIRMVAVGVNT